MQTGKKNIVGLDNLMRNSCRRKVPEFHPLQPPPPPRYPFQAALHLVLVHEVDYWVGLADFEEEGTFVWQESQAEPTYTNWVSGQPDSADGNEDCVYLHVSGTAVNPPGTF